jgi:polysaccharide pyruvyl transferase WcaK-like protein
MRVLLEAAKNIGDCYLLPGYLTAPELKWFISKLDCLVAARTHATIASFSSCIPTISMAYSTKAYGINSQILGNTDYVIDSHDLCVESVVDKIRMVFQNEKEIKDKLAVVIPKIQETAYQSGELLRKILP